MFRSHIDDDEKTLFVSGNGKVEGGYGTRDSNMKALMAFLISAAIFAVMFGVGILTDEMNLGAPFLLIIFAVMVFPGIIILTIILWIAFGGLTGSANYAITDKRVLANVQNIWQEIRLKDVKNTGIRNGIITVTSVHGEMLGIYYVPNKPMAKAILDDAVRKCKSKQDNKY